MQAVKIKSSKYGLNLILDADLPFEELRQATEDKFKSAAHFFKGADMAISFEGRELSPEEEDILVETITSCSDVNIVCIMDMDAVKDAVLKQQIDRFRPKPEKKQAESEPDSSDHTKEPETASSETEQTAGEKTGEVSEESVQKAAEEDAAPSSELESASVLHVDGFYCGTLRSGQILESPGSVIVAGDVNPGARVISYGSIVILGSLKGIACAGANGDRNGIIAAIEMDPIQIQIGDILAKSPDTRPTRKRLRKRSKESEIKPQIAYARENNIFMEPLTREVISSLS